MIKKKLCFFGLFGQQNLGNDCTLTAIISNVRRYQANKEIKCICTGPREISEEHHISTFLTHETYLDPVSSKFWKARYAQPIRLIRKYIVRIPMELFHWLRAFRYLEDSDTLIFPGTGILSDYSTSPMGWPYNIFKWSIISRIRRCRLLFVSIGAGPISHPMSKWFLKSSLSLANYRSYRDQYSQDYLAEHIGFGRESDRLFPDLAFSLPIDMMPAPENRGSKRPIVGIGIMDYHGVLGRREGNTNPKYHGFISKLGVFLIWLIEHNYDVRMLVGDTFHDSRAKNDLLDLIQNSVTTNERGHIFDDPILSVEDLLIQLSTTDFVISPRYHNIILALMLNKPAISLSYHPKFTSLMADIGLADYCQDIDDLDVARLIKQLKDLENNADKLKLQIKQKTEEYRNILDEQYEEIFGEIHPAGESLFSCKKE